MNLSAQLVRVLREGPGSAPLAPIKPLDSSFQRRCRWKIRDRFSEDEIAELVHVFKAGTPKHILAKRYGINRRSLKKLLREEGVKRKSRWDRLG
jgi:hypothetical protein